MKFNYSTSIKNYIKFILVFISCSTILVGCNLGSTSPSSATTQSKILNSTMLPSGVYAYVVNNWGSVSICNIGKNGALNTCNYAIQNGVMGVPTGIAFLSLNKITYAYVTDPGSVGNSIPVWVCIVNSTTGMLTNCKPSPSDNKMVTPYGIAINAYNGINYAYIADGSGVVWVCTLDPVNAGLTNCHTTGNIPAAAPPSGGIAFYPYNGTTYAYITTPDISGVSSNNNVTVCSVTTNGDLTNCSQTGTVIYPLVGKIAINAYKGMSYAYVANSDGVAVCGLTSGDILTNCSNSGNNMKGPDGIAFNTYNGTTYIYVTNYFANNISVCTLITNGALTNCNNSISISEPVNIAFLQLP